MNLCNWMGVSRAENALSVLALLIKQCNDVCSYVIKFYVKHVLAYKTF